jgi:hypothetical protein
MSALLKLVHLSEVSFRKSEATNLDEMLKRARLVMATREAAAFISMRGDQILMVRVKSVAWHDGKIRRVYHSQKFRVDGTTWTPEDLFRAAKEFGVDLAWLRRQFVSYFNEIEGG